MSALAEPEAIYKVLVVDDDAGVLGALRRALLEEYVVLAAPSGEEALSLLRAQDDVAVIVSDQRMPGMTGADFLAEAVQLRPHTQRIVLTGYTDYDDVVRMINDGKIHYYLSKPWEAADLKLTLRRACEVWQLGRENRHLLVELQKAHAQLQKENAALRTEVLGRYAFESVIGSSEAMRGVMDLLRKVVVTDTSVLLLGETGSGKEVLARALHYAGPRGRRPFVAQNCAALPETLLVSELFGHTKGSFTGAIRDKKGLFEQADGGTIFLDEIGETSPAFQQQLLRVLQEGEITPVGAEKTVQVDVRVLAATNRNLQAEVEAGRFREDLYYRLAVFPILVPPLRERGGDIALLVEHFLGRFSERMGKPGITVSAEALNELADYPWPGNVRELENEIERALVLTDPGGQIAADILSPRVRGGRLKQESAPPAGALSAEQARAALACAALDGGQAIKESVEALERALLRQAMERCGPNKAQIARTLGLSRMGLDKKLARYKMKLSRSGGDEN